MPDIEAKSKEKSTAKKDKSTNKRFDGLKRFFVETKAEFRKIVWPTPKETFNQTVVVLVSIIVIAAFIFGLDTLSRYGLNAILQRL